jgi:hypothetical protein
LITCDNREEAIDNAKLMLERFNQAPTREQKLKIKRALVYAANKISKQGNKSVVEPYRAVVAQMVLPPKEKPMPFRKKTIRKTEVLGLRVKKETEEIQMSHVPSEVTKEKGESLIVDAKYGPFGMGSSLAAEEKTTLKFPKEKKRPSLIKGPYV